MLVLSRHRDESIIIGDDVVVTIVDIRGDKVRLGIQAPEDVPVHRREVYDAIKRENEKAAQLQPADTREIGAVDVLPSALPAPANAPVRGPAFNGPDHRLDQVIGPPRTQMG